MQFVFAYRSAPNHECARPEAHMHMQIAFVRLHLGVMQTASSMSRIAAHPPLKGPAMSNTSNIIDAKSAVSLPKGSTLFIDVRLGEPDKEKADFEKSHVQGGVYAQIREVFASAPTPTSGNLPLPSIEKLQAQLEQWGVSNQTNIIVYGPTPAVAARGWWVLLWAGLTNVRLLDGGLAAWTAAGGAVESGESKAKVAAFNDLQLSQGHLPQATVDEVQHLESSSRVVDARDAASYQAGHIPNAVNVPAPSLWDATGKLAEQSVLRERFSQAGVKASADNVIYCGGGVLSALEVLLLEELSIPSRLYVGSWSEWSKDALRPRQTEREVA